MHFAEPQYALTVEEDLVWPKANNITSCRRRCFLKFPNNVFLDRFGCRYRSNVTGIIYNDDMADFDIPEWEKVDGISPSPVNFPEPGKRPFSSMSPAILTDDKGDVQLVIGASGGKRITTAVSLVRATDKPELYADVE